jgi:GNAT superfamily N-acetyltransferase
MQDVIMSLFDEGCVAIVPTDTTSNPIITGSYDISSMRVGQIMQWYPSAVRVKVYNEKVGQHEEMTIPKKMVAIIENPFYAVMNEHNSTLQRLIRKLNLLDVIDEQSGSGKLDIIVQVPYILKTQARQDQAAKRKQDIEDQLAGSKYGIAYTDSTEKVTQLNRPVENNLMKQIEYLMSMLYSQLSITMAVLDGTADEKTMLNYSNRTVEPLLSAVIDEMKRKFLTRTARSQLQSIVFFRDAFKLVPVTDLANIADKFTRNEILSSNEVRGIVGFKPSDDPKADELRNKNINAPEPGTDQSLEPQNSEKDDATSQSNLNHYGVKGMHWGFRKSAHSEGDITIQKVKKADLEGITRLFNGLSEKDKKFLVLDQKLSLIKKNIRDERHCFVSKVKGETVGFLRESGRPEGFVLLEELVVDPKHRNQGIASQMLDDFHTLYPKTLAKTRANNKGMASLLKENGYKPDNPDSSTVINWIRDENHSKNENKKATRVLNDMLKEEIQHGWLNILEGDNKNAEEI